MNSKLRSLSDVVTSKMGRHALKIQKASPTIMFSAGVVGVVATVVLASKATLKLDDIVEGAQNQIDLSKELVEAQHEKYSEQDHKQDVAIIWVRTATRVCKLYAPSVAVGVVSIGLLTGAHVTLNRRNAGLVAAYAALDKGFKEYRERVLAEFGEDKERELRFGTDTREVYSEGKKGEPIVEQVKTAGGPSIYARFFDSTNQNYNPTPDYNYLFIKAQQNYLNDRLNAKGHVMLNEAYDALGLDRTSAGAVVGWVKGYGDGYVDFGIHDNEDRFVDFMTGREGALMLDFNVDGVVYDLIDQI